MTTGDHGPKAGMLCPSCGVPLTMSERQNIEIDYCARCRGVWLDRGELDKIIERSLSQTVPPSGGGRHESYGHGKHGYRKKSWLHELFD